MRNKYFFKKKIAYFFHILKSKGANSAQPGFRVLLYHSVGNPAAEDVLGLKVAPGCFYNQMKLLKDGNYRVLRLKELADCLSNRQDLPKNCVGIAFDDGYRDNLTEVLPVLKQFGFPATVFLRAGLFGPLGNLKEKYWEKWEYLCAEEAKKLSDSGLIDIGSHAITHKKLTEMDCETLEKEASGSKALLETLIGRPVDLFSYPFGYANRRVKAVIRQSGYKAAFGSFIGSNNYSSERFGLRRTEISSLDDLAEFEKKLKGDYDWLYFFQKSARIR